MRRMSSCTTAIAGFAARSRGGSGRSIGAGGFGSNRSKRLTASSWEFPRTECWTPFMSCTRMAASPRAAMPSRPSLARFRLEPVPSESSGARPRSWASSTGSMGSSRGSAVASFAAWSLRGGRRVRAFDERAERLQVFLVPGVPAREFEAARNPAELFLVHEESERLFSEFPLPDVLMAVQVRSEVAHRIVQMKRADPSQADGLANRADERVVTFPRSEIVARGEGVARVDADPEAVRMGAPFDDFRELLEPRANDASLARRVLKDREDVGRVRMVKGPVEALRRRPDRGGLPLPSVARRMKDHVADAEGLRPVEFLDERLAAVFDRVVVRTAEVDQVVRVDHRADDPVFLEVLAEPLRLLRRQGLRAPKHPRATRENLNRLGPDRPAAFGRQCDVLRNRDVGPEVHGSPVGPITFARMSLPIWARFGRSDLKRRQVGGTGGRNVPLMSKVESRSTGMIPLLARVLSMTADRRLRLMVGLDMGYALRRPRHA